MLARAQTTHFSIYHDADSGAERVGLVHAVATHTDLSINPKYTHPQTHHAYTHTDKESYTLAAFRSDDTFCVINFTRGNYELTCAL